MPWLTGIDRMRKRAGPSSPNLCATLSMPAGGGRLAFTTWSTPADNVAWRLLFDAIRAHGDMEAAATVPPSGGNLGTSEAVLSLLRDAGFGICLAAPVRREWLVTAPRDIVAAL